MSDRVVLKGAFRLVITDALKRLLNQLAQRRFPHPKDHAKKAEVLAAILGHPYLYHDPWSAAEERHRVERFKRGLDLLEGLKIRLQRGEIHYKGIENATGQPELNLARLKDHSVRLLDLSGDWLLLSIERHPEGGSGIVRRQYWLYDRRGRVLNLLHADTVAKITDGQWKVQRGNGPWRDVDITLEKDFFDTVGRQLGSEALASIRQSGILDDRLAHPPPEVFAECQLICGIDYVTEEAQRRERHERTYLQKYGPRESGIRSISTAAIELIYADEEKPSKPE